jgi:hypothetical protein
VAIPAGISLTESQGFQALGDYVVAVTGLAPGQVVQGQQNRVAEPPLPDFVVMTSLRQERLGTNETGFADNVVVGSIAGPVLTVTEATQLEGPGLVAGMLLIDDGYPATRVAPNTVIQSQASGTPGGVGVYAVSPSQTLASETLYAGQRQDLVPTKWTVQLDVHGPSSGDNAKKIEGLWFSEYAVDQFATSGFDVTPLYCGEARQVPFVNAESEYEERYVIEAAMQVNPVVSTPQQFFDQARVETIEVQSTYPP